MKTIKQFLLSAIIVAGTSTSFAQISVDGNVFNGTTAVQGEAVVLDWGAGSTTVYTDNVGHYNYSITSSATQGALSATIIDCNGYSISENGSWYPGVSSINLTDLSYCSSSNFDVNLSLGFLNNSGSAVSVNVSWDGGTTYSSVNTDVAGNYTTTYSTTGPGIFSLNYDDCNGNTFTLTENYSFTNDYISINNIDYCPVTAPTCQANFSLAQQLDPTQTSFINVIDIYNSSIGSGLTYTWDFGDGSPTYTGTNFTHNYVGYGTYNLCLTVDNGNGCTDTFCESLVMASNGLLNGKANENFTLVMGTGVNSTETASIDNIQKELNVSVYPNPTTSNTIVSINSNSNQVVTIQVLDLSGKIVLNNSTMLSIGNQKVNLDLNSISKGIYLVKISTKTDAYNTKLIIK